jgi:lipopolysaccharide export system protein LptA
MRRAGPLIVLLFLLIVAGVGASYYARLKEQSSNAPQKPKALPANITASAQDWTYTQHGGANGKPVAFVRAKDFNEVQGKYELTGVELDLFHKEGDQYDQVKSAKAEFDINQGILYSEGAVEITMAVPADEGPNSRLMVIQSSHVHFESKTGKAYTDDLAKFKFDRGDGQAVGANYDPNTRELLMRSQVQLIWRGSEPGTTPMKVETNELNYKERDSKVFLSPWSKLTRDTLTLNAGPATVTVDKGNIKLVETTQANGSDQRPGRNIEYSADQLTMEFDDSSQVKKITGVGNAKLVTTAETTITTMTADRVDLDFDTLSGDSSLQTALATGHGTAESKPIPKPGTDTPETRILRSEVIKTNMRPGGREIDSVETETPGALEFLPNRPDQPHRFMNGDKIWIAYGPKNQIQTFKSVNVSTRTLNARPKGSKQEPSPALTWSKDILATFQPNSSQISKIEQWNDFRYEEGDRKAKADRAVLDQPNNIITLVKGARISDATGTADADTIVLDQKTGDFTAEGNVNSTRLPDKKKESNEKGGILSEDEPLHAKAKKMASSNNHLQIRYAGDVVLWQGANKLQADDVEIDRDNNNLNARGHVLSELLDKAKGDDTKDKAATKTPARVFTIVKAPELVYNDDDRLAVYKGGAVLNRPDMQVKGETIRAYLRDESNDSSLDHAFADGKVEINQSSAGRKRNGTSEHAEYYVDEDKVILQGGQPQFIDSLRGTTRGDKLTWFSKDDRLLVNGVETAPVKSVLRRKKNAPVK